MAYEHTVKATEMATSVSTPRQVDSSIPLFIGCSPINMTGDLTNVNKINLYMDQQSAVLGEGLVLPEDGKFKFSNSEAIYAAFTLMAVAPIMVVNVLDPVKHKTSVTDEAVTIVDGVGVLLNSGVLKDTVVVTGAALNTDYVLTWTNRGLLQINKTEKGTLPDLITVTYDYLDPTKVTSTDIIGGIDSATGANTGLELINSAYTETGLMVGQLVAAGFSGTSEVASSMTTKADSINGVFSCMSLHDLPTDTIRKHTDTQAYKKANNIVNENQIALWPKTSLGGTQYNASIIQAVVTMATDADYSGIPYKSPSNEYAPMDSAVLEDGTVVSLTMDNTAYLNGQGICTFLNLDGWKTRGNNTAAYPANTDVKDRFISVKRMFKWIANTAILTDWKNLDAPINQRLIDTIQDSNNLWLNTLSGQEALVGNQNRVEVLAFENQLTDTLNGKITYHWYITPPTPAEVIHHVIEYDVNNLAELFNGGAS